MTQMHACSSFCSQRLLKKKKNPCFFLLLFNIDVRVSLRVPRLIPRVLKFNDHISLQWPSYEQPQGLNLRPKRKQTSWSKTLPIRLSKQLKKKKFLVLSPPFNGAVYIKETINKRLSCDQVLLVKIIDCNPRLSLKRFYFERNKKKSILVLLI